MRPRVGTPRLSELIRQRLSRQVLSSSSAAAYRGKCCRHCRCQCECYCRTDAGGTHRGFDRAANDPGVRYTFYLMTQVALASRTSDWEGALGERASAWRRTAPFSTSPPRCRMPSIDTLVRIHPARQAFTGSRPSSAAARKHCHPLIQKSARTPGKMDCSPVLPPREERKVWLRLCS